MKTDSQIFCRLLGIAVFLSLVASAAHAATDSVDKRRTDKSTVQEATDLLDKSKDGKTGANSDTDLKLTEGTDQVLLNQSKRPLAINLEAILDKKAFVFYREVNRGNGEERPGSGEKIVTIGLNAALDGTSNVIKIRSDNGTRYGMETQSYRVQRIESAGKTSNISVNYKGDSVVFTRTGKNISAIRTGSLSNALFKEINDGGRKFTSVKVSNVFGRFKPTNDFSVTVSGLESVLRGESDQIKIKSGPDGSYPRLATYTVDSIVYDSQGQISGFRVSTEKAVFIFKETEIVSGSLYRKTGRTPFFTTRKRPQATTWINSNRNAMESIPTTNFFNRFIFQMRGLYEI